MRKLFFVVFLSGVVLKYSSNAILKYKNNMDDMITVLNLKINDIEHKLNEIENKTISEITTKYTGDIEEYKNIIEKQSNILVIQRNMIEIDLKEDFAIDSEFTEVDQLDSDKSKIE